MGPRSGVTVNLCFAVLLPAIVFPTAAYVVSDLVGVIAVLSISADEGRRRGGRGGLDAPEDAAEGRQVRVSEACGEPLRRGR